MGIGGGEILLRKSENGTVPNGYTAEELSAALESFSLNYI